MGWNDERVELLKKLWSEGLSASQIATKLGNVTRNAVIGKVHRLGLSGRATTSRMKTHRSRPRAAASGGNAGSNASGAANTKRNNLKARYATIGNAALRALYQQVDSEPFTPESEEVEIPLAERKTIQTLTECSCRWPIGDPQLTDFHFCGRKKMTGLPYCEAHARRAFQPPQPRRRDIIAPSLPVEVSAPIDATVKA